MAGIDRIDENNFEEEVLKSDLPVVVDFYAPWCGPCRMLAPIIEKVAEEFAGKVKVVKVNIDEEPKLAAKFGVRSIPTVIGFKDGAPKQTFIGYGPEKKVKEFFEKLLF